jgi:signal transduction histidine kinase
MTSQHGTKRMTAIVLRGSLIISIALSCLLAVHGLMSGNLLTMRILCGVMIIAYLILGEFLIKRQHYILVGWMIMFLYTLLSSVTLLLWGLNAPVAILSLGFVIFLSGVMLGPKHIIWVISSVTILLFTIQYIHESTYIRPDLKVLAKPSDYFDVLAYVTILGIFALLSWLSGKQTERSINRARVAEQKLRIEKDNLAIRLEEQSRQLHQTQLQEMLRLYKFAEIGQTTTATLHELSNLLSVLTLDIDDIGQKYQRSQAIINAKDGIEHINYLVHQTRRQLYDNQTSEVFNSIPIIEQAIKEFQSKLELKGIQLTKQIPQRKSFRILGDTLNLSHVITILLNNALDACVSQNDGKVLIRILQKQDILTVAVLDNGPGIPKDKWPRLFNPHESTKPNGLGIGLYITKHIIESQFHGKIYINPSKIGSLLIVELPRYKESTTTL